MNSKRFSQSFFALAALAAAVAPGRAETRTLEPLRIIQTTEPQFPVALDTLTVSNGEACVLINVDADGKLADWLVLSYTHKAFADETVRALQEWRYEPARLNGERIGVRVPVTFTFETKGRIVSAIPTDYFEYFVRSWRGEYVIFQVCRPQELDQPLQVLKAVKPRYAADGKRPGGANGRILLDFYVDETGRPRMPVVMNATDNLLAAAAVNALEQWRFAVPTRGSMPVAVHAQQEFVFSD